MDWRKALLTGVLASGLSLCLVPRAVADPPPWAGKWHHHDKDWKHDHDRWRHDHDWDHDRWRHDRDWYRDHDWRRYGHYDRDDRWRYRDRDRDGDWWRWRDRSRYGGNYHDPNGDRYRQLMDRMNNDQAKINEIGPTGRHRKALQWYKDDMRNAQRDMDQYRAGR
jgi:hypothetical protein